MGRINRLLNLEVDVVDRIARFRYGRPASPGVLYRVVAGGLFLPAVSLYAVFASVCGLSTNDVLFLPFRVPAALDHALSYHRTMFLILLLGFGLAGIVRWWHVKPQAVHSRAAAGLHGFSILVVSSPRILNSAIQALVTVAVWGLIDSLPSGSLDARSDPAGPLDRSPESHRKRAAKGVRLVARLRWVSTT